MAKKPAKKPVKKATPVAKKKPAAKRALKAAPLGAAAKAVLKAAAAVDWARASKDEIDHVDKLLTDLAIGKPAAREKAYARLHKAAVGRPFATVVGPFLVDLAMAGGARCDALRLLASIREHAPPAEWRSGQRLTRALAALPSQVVGFLGDSDPDVRAAAALVASTFEGSADSVAIKNAVVDVLERETDARAKVCLLAGVWAEDVSHATRFLDDADPRVSIAAACALARPERSVEARVIDLLERGLDDSTLDAFPWPDRPLRGFALARISELAQPELRDRLAAIYARLLDQPLGALAAGALLQLAFPAPADPSALSAFQKDSLRKLVESEPASKVVLAKASSLGLPFKIEPLRRLAGIREPVPEGWVLGVELTIDGITDSALGFWKSYIQTGIGDALVLATAIAAALPPASCAEAVLEGCKLGTGQYEDHGWTAPPLPEGGVLGAKENWETWTVYKQRSITEVTDAYEKQLVAAGYQILGRTDAPDDTRLVAIRDGSEVDATFYWNEVDGTYGSASGYPELFTTFVDAALARHGQAFVDAYVAIIKTMSTPAGKKRVEAFQNVGYWLPKAALVIAKQTQTAPDPAFDQLVAEHQKERNVLLGGHRAYLALVPPDRRTQMIKTIISDGKFMELAREFSSPDVLDVAAQGFITQLSYTRSGYDDDQRTGYANEWVFLGDRAVDAIQNALKRKKVGNPDIAAEILLLIGTPAARKALDKLAKHPDKAVQKIVQAALVN